MTTGRGGRRKRRRAQALRKQAGRALMSRWFGSPPLSRAARRRLLADIGTRPKLGLRERRRRAKLRRRRARSTWQDAARRVMRRIYAAVERAVVTPPSTRHAESIAFTIEVPLVDLLDSSTAIRVLDAAIREALEDKLRSL